MANDRSGENESKGPEAMKSDFFDIFNALRGAKGCAQAFSQLHPEHYEAVDEFTKEIDQIGLELKNDVCAESESPMHWERATIEAAIVHDLVNFLIKARSYADRVSQRNPEYMVPLKRFHEELQRIQNELLRTIRPGWLSDEE
jgi:hypothetical protein